MEEKFLDKDGLQKVAENINSRLKTVETMPANPKDGQIVLYVGESGMVYTQGCIYQFDENEDEWIDITSGGTVDQNFNPNSSNAQSGIAVDEAKTVLFNKLFSRNTWESKTWTGDENYNGFAGSYIWTDGENIYISSTSEPNYNYVLDRATSTWIPKTWYGLTTFNALSVWSDGVDFYYSNGPSNQYKLNKATSTWEPKTWNILVDDGQCIWTDGTDIYYSNGSENQYILNKTTGEWEIKTWMGFDAYGYNIWTDGTDIYYSGGEYQYKLNKSTSTWEEKTWYGLTQPGGEYIWTDGANIYYCSGWDMYILNKATSTWEAKTWNIELYGDQIWHDGNNIYYSYGSDQYVLAKSLKTYID